MSQKPTPETAPLMHAAANESIEAMFLKGCQLERELAEATKERDHLRKLINNFCANQKWAAESWKAQEHIKPLFDVFIGGKNNE